MPYVRNRIKKPYILLCSARNTQLESENAALVFRAALPKGAGPGEMDHNVNISVALLNASPFHLQSSSST